MRSQLTLTLAITSTVAVVVAAIVLHSSPDIRWMLSTSRLRPAAAAPPQGFKRASQSSAAPAAFPMAWHSSGSTNTALVTNLARNYLIKADRVKNAMLGVDRGHYAPYMPYNDEPQSIGYGATISAPHMHASACESLLPFLRPGAHVLDVGSGSGYLTHVLAKLIEPGGKVIGVDHIQGLVDLAKANTAKSEDGKEFLSSGLLKFVKADGRKGFKEEGPYDAIHVGAAATEAHQELIDQLKAPGRLFIPVGTHSQYIWVIDKSENGTVEKRREFGVRYVPLTDAPKE